MQMTLRKRSTEAFIVAVLAATAACGGTHTPGLLDGGDDTGTVSAPDGGAADGSGTGTPDSGTSHPDATPVPDAEPDSTPPITKHDAGEEDSGTDATVHDGGESDAADDTGTDGTVGGDSGIDGGADAGDDAGDSGTVVTVDGGGDSAADSSSGADAASDGSGGGSDGASDGHADDAAADAAADASDAGADGATDSGTDSAVQAAFFQYSNPLTDGGLTGWTAWGAPWTLGGSGYTQPNAGAQGARTQLSGATFGDFVATVDIAPGSISSGFGDCGLVFRVSDPGTGDNQYDGYYAGLRNETTTSPTGLSFVFGYASAGTWTEVTNASSPIVLDSSASYTMTVTAIGPSITVNVTGGAAPVNYTYTLPDAGGYLSGEIGFRTYQRVATFSNLTVTNATGSTLGMTYQNVFGGSDAGANWSGSTDAGLLEGPVNGFDVYGGTWAAGSGSAGSSSGNGDKVVLDGFTFSDFTLQADVTFASATGNAGFNVRMTNPETGVDALTGYYFGIDETAGGWVLGYETDASGAPGTYGGLASGAISGVGLTIPIKIVVSGETYEFYVNGTLEETYTWTTTPAPHQTQGMIGLRTDSTADVTWSNVYITTP